MSISIEKINPNQTITTETSISSEFAGNISFDVGWGIETKTGLKFGASAKTTKQTSYKTTTTLSNKSLGAVRVHFEHPVVLTTGKILSFKYCDIKEYDNGMFVITVEPKIQ
jgi:hypothetical protein